MDVEDEADDEPGDMSQTDCRNMFDVTSATDYGSFVEVDDDKENSSYDTALELL